MGSLLALVSSVLWGAADYIGGNLSKRFKSIAVTGVSQSIGLLFGIAIVLISGSYIAPTLDWNGYF